MTGAVQGTSVQDTNAINQQIQDFKDGKIQITKNDLKNIVSSAISQGETPSSTVLDIIDSYDKIDTNGDGISYSEFENYKNTPAGILSSMGMSAHSLKYQTSLLDFGLFDESSENDSMFSLLGSSISSSSSSSYLSGLLENYSSTDNNNSLSLVDYLT